MFDSTRGCVWGAEGPELTDVYRCEAYVPEPRERLLRAVTIDADPATVFRWVCQLKVAPYSYDLIDNLGRRSPRDLTPGADSLEIGQRMMVATIVEYDDRQVTGVGTPLANRLFGRMALTYRVEAQGAQRCRLVACLVVANAGLMGRVRTRLLAYGDLVMMRKQLLTLKSRAEASSRDQEAAAVLRTPTQTDA